MTIPFLVLCLQTFVLWIIAIILHRLKDRLTLIPLYSYIAVLTVITHNFSDLGFSVSYSGWVFFISSFSFFTTLMLSAFLLYLFEGPRAGRIALQVILLSSFLYIGIVYSLGFQIDTTNWVEFNLEHAFSYFWSIFAIILDIVLLAALWEFLSRVAFLNLFLKVFITFFSILSLDTFIFTTGVFGREDFYLSMLGGNVTIRLVLSLISAPIVTYFVSAQGYSEEKRDKPKNYLEILNFRSDLESKIQVLENVVEYQKNLEKKLRESEEKYELAISGVGAGIWDWDIVSDKINWSLKVYSLLGYEEGELGTTLEDFKKMLHPDDVEKTLYILDQSFKSIKPYETEYRLKTKSGEYKWFAANGITKYEGGKPVRMIGSLIDINERKNAEKELSKKLEELQKLNNFMVGRELKMVEMKKEIERLEKK